MTKYAIIGFGCAGYHAAVAIRDRDSEGIIDVYSNHEESPYNPMLTTYAASGKLPRAAMFPFGELDTISRKYNLNIKTKTEVKKLLTTSNELVLDEGSSHKYDRILISTGAKAAVPPLPGLNGDGIYVMRTHRDSENLYTLLRDRKPRDAIVVGGSMVGIKVAELLNNAGVKTTIMDQAPYIFPLAAYPDVGDVIGKRIERRGVSLLFGKGLTRIEKSNAKQHVVLDDGTALSSDIVVLCIGTRANTSIVDQAEIEIGRAIRVNSKMETSKPGIFAAGDCCEGTDIQSGNSMIIGLWANAGYQGRTAGTNMSGGDAQYDGNILHNITHFMDMDFIGLGDNRIRGEEISIGKADGESLYIKAYLKDGKLAGVNILDNYRISGIVKNFFLKRLRREKEKINALQRAILLKEGLSENFIDRLEDQRND